MVIFGKKFAPLEKFVGSVGKLEHRCTTTNLPPCNDTIIVLKKNILLYIVSVITNFVIPKVVYPLKPFLQYFAWGREPQDRTLVPNFTAIALKMWPYGRQNRKKIAIFGINLPLRKNPGAIPRET